MIIILFLYLLFIYLYVPSLMNYFAVEVWGHVKNVNFVDILAVICLRGRDNRRMFGK